MQKTSGLLFLLIPLLNASGAPVPPPSAAELIRRSEIQARGKTLEARVLMRVVRGKEIRSLDFLLWTKGTDRAVVKVLAPENERATASLRIGGEFWSYTPAIERVQKLPPSTLKRAWMGSDFTNGDLVRNTNLSRFYEHRLIGQEKRESVDVVVIESLPRKGAPVEPGKILTWLARADSVLIRQEYYGANGNVERTLTTKGFRTSGEYRYASSLVVTKAGESANYTQIDYRAAHYDRPLADAIFTQEFLRKRIDSLLEKP